MKPIVCALFVSLFATLAFADETSFQRVKVPDPKGRAVSAVLTFSDSHKAIEIQPIKGGPISIPYAEIDKFEYAYTKRHRVTEGTVATAPFGIGAAAMLTKSRSHWLEIHFREDEIPKTYVLRMDKHDYIRILDAVKAHTGKDLEVLGNADKRKR